MLFFFLSLSSWFSQLIGSFFSFNRMTQFNWNFRSVIFSCCINYNRIIKVEEIKIENTDNSEKRSKKELEKEAEALANHQQIHPSPHQNISIPHFRHVAIPRIRVPVIPPIVAHPTGQIRIFVVPPQKKYWNEMCLDEINLLINHSKNSFWELLKTTIESRISKHYFLEWRREKLMTRWVQ